MPERIEQIESDYEKCVQRLQMKKPVNALRARLNAEDVDEVYKIDEAESSCLVCHK